jgi:hypothetical protein
LFFSCCARVASSQATVWAPAWAPRSATCEHLHNECRRRKPHRRPHRGIINLPSVLLLLRGVGLRRVAAPAWAPRSGTCEHVDKGASTPEAAPRHYAAESEVGALTS